MTENRKYICLKDLNCTEIFDDKEKCSCGPNYPPNVDVNTKWDDAYFFSGGLNASNNQVPYPENSIG